jgi:hypothetical protein
VLGALELSNKMMAVGSQAVRAAAHSDASARTHTQERNMDQRIRLAKKFTMFETPIVAPRPLSSFQNFASICYSDLHEVLKQVQPTVSVSGSVTQRTTPPNGTDTDSGLPQFRGPRARVRSQTRQNVPIDTVSNNVTLRGLVLEYLHQTAADMSVPESEVCWFVDTGHAISPTLNLAYSSSLSSRECTASVLLNYVTVAFEHALHLQFGVTLCSCTQ